MSPAFVFYGSACCVALLTVQNINLNSKIKIKINIVFSELDTSV